MLIQDPSADTASTLAIGGWPASSGEALVTVADIDLRLHRLLQDDLRALSDTSIDPDTLRGLVDELQRSSEDGSSAYHRVVLAHLYCLLNDFDGVQALLAIDFDYTGSDFDVYLAIRARAVTCYAMRESSEHESVARDASRDVSRLRVPSATNTRGRLWLDRVFQIAQPPSSLEKLQSTCEPDVCLAFGAWAVQNARTDSTFAHDFAAYATLRSHALQQLRFPSATETSAAAEQLIAGLHYAWDAGVLRSAAFKPLIVQSLSVSYQSTLILASFIDVLIRLGEWKEVLAAFETYVEYTDKHEIQTHQIGDLLEIVHVYSRTIGTIVGVDAIAVDDGAKRGRLEAFASQLEGYLEMACARGGIRSADACAQEGREEVSDDTRDISRGLARILAAGYAALARYHTYVAQHAHSDATLQSSLSLSLAHFHKAVNLFPSREHILPYAIQLTKTKAFPEVIRLMKLELRRDPADVQCWHLLALCYSTDEATVPTALKLLGNAVAMAETLAEGSTLSVATKTRILQMKMTLVALCELLDGLDAAMELLPGVFALYHVLFARDIEERKMTGMTPDVEKENKLKRMLTGSKKREKVVSAENGMPRDANARDLLARMWLWAATLYMKAGALEEAESAIADADGCVGSIGTHAETRADALAEILAARGFLAALRGDHHTAARAFETGLETATSLHCTLGLSSLLLQDDAYHSAAATKYFKSPVDKSSALVRLKLALETLARDYRYFNQSEIWWYLSKIYEIFDDKVLLQQALWKCVAAEQGKPVRAFSVCE
ncbi:hypothetical protein BABINDRAFT_160890 [Babjeviella inositovora NRRL Y-12698]|uniref:Cargo-transport protein YPP1 n=1 Tax=Babjeviella inositovora NRRL Y-12698 TaxID=984486 RepID=A0A1E3QSH8_9ASCO|nr:uncharacterized protein BABINDRAFT_160890 [Babjeviella inositovora NRRL Y-12698]ODQ80641.1 hypothetical protein BABINDRAFT_160890 [Babjeviella inositovora NRRL Y-12698]